MNIQELLQKSKSLFESKQYLTAKEYAQASLEQDQNCIEALFLLAQCDDALGKTKAMASSLFKILSIDTSNGLAIKKLREAGFLGKEKANDVELKDNYKYYVNDQIQDNYKYYVNDQIQDPVISVKPHTLLGDNYYKAELQSGNNLYFRVDSQGCTIVGPTKEWIGGYAKPTGRLVIPDSFRIESFKTISIGNDAFSLIDKITDVVLPEGLQSIQESAFYGVKITKIELPSSLKMIGDSAFYGSLLEHVILPSSLKAIGACCFYGCHNLKKVVLNEGLVSIGMMAFGGSGIAEVDIPSSLVRMNYDAFNEETIIRFHGNPPKIVNEWGMTDQEYLIYVKKSKEILFKRDEFWRNIKLYTF